MTGDLFENNEFELPKPNAEKGSLKEYTRKAQDECLHRKLGKD